MSAHAPLRVIIDTDPGLDDAVAILFALSVKRFSVEAITAVAGNIGIATTTRNVGRLLAVMGRADIAYAAGASRPLGGDARDEAAIHGADGLGGVALPAPLGPADGRGALALLVERLHAAPPGALTVLALGPLTNLGLLARDMPDVYRRIGRIIAMGGTIEEPGNAGPLAEFNMAADPMAAQRVFDGGVPVTLIPLDVTRRMRANAEDLDRLSTLATPAARHAAALVRAYFSSHAERRSRPLHDPCVMLMALAPELFGTQRMRVAVDPEAHPGRLVPCDGGALLEIAMTIEAEAARDMLWAGLGGKL